MNGSRNGHVRYLQNGNGNLVVRVELTYAWPSTTYHIFLVCGPAHTSSCGFVDIGTVTTDSEGRGAAVVASPGAPFGTGFRTDHVDLMQNAGDESKGSFAAGAVNYFQPATPAPSGRINEGDPNRKR
jgi:hypothetical protein